MTAPPDAARALAALFAKMDHADTCDLRKFGPSSSISDPWEPSCSCGLGEARKLAEALTVGPADGGPEPPSLESWGVVSDGMGRYGVTGDCVTVVMFSTEEDAQKALGLIRTCAGARRTSPPGMP